MHYGLGVQGLWWGLAATTTVQVGAVTLTCCLLEHVKKYSVLTVGSQEVPEPPKWAYEEGVHGINKAAAG